MIEYNMYIISLSTECLKNVKLSLLKIFCLYTVVRYHSVLRGRSLKTEMMPGNRVMSRQHLSQTWQKSYDVDNVWFDLNDVFADNIEEVMEKWDGIDDQIWGKVIVMEKNCRVAKMFLSKSEMEISNDHCGFDISGRIGLRGFDNKMRDSETTTVLRTLGKGCSVWMDPG